MYESALPDYSVRRSTRARRIRLSVTARDGLVVVVPERWCGDADEIVRSKRAWAERALEAVAERRALVLAGVEAWLPHRVELDSLGMSLPVEYVERAGDRTCASVRDGALVVHGRIEDADACADALRRWLVRESRAGLPPRLFELAGQHGFSPAAVRVTGARTRWGSCSARGTISLNRNLAFLPVHLCDALMLHELAHLRVLDHSPRFWSLLATMDERVLEHRAELKGAGRYVPVWADAR